MSLFPKYVFNDDTDYNAVWDTTREMSVYLDAQSNGCCKSDKMLKTMYQATVKMQNVIYNSAGDLNDVERWKKGIEISYKLLYPLT